jgi:RND family efflux transporter MFP subunit
MKTRRLKTIRLVGMVSLTMGAVALMVFVSGRNDKNGAAKHAAEQNSPSNKLQPSAFVTVRELVPETVEILDIYAGKIRPWEQYSVGFELSGRIKELGTNRAGQMLDEGDFVSAGQVLARIDDRVLRARKNEAEAEWERAKTNLERAKDLQSRGVGGISETDYLDRLTIEATAKATYEMASKNLEDAVITSPVDAVIAKRRIKPGESTTSHAAVFELVEYDPILLVLDVPESRVREIEHHLQEVDRNRLLRDSTAVVPGDMEFFVHVEMESENRYGQKWPSLSGTVHQVAETADTRTGLFEVEVRLANPHLLLKPGMVARASLVTDRIEAYRIPITSVLFRFNQASFFTLDREPVEVSAMFWSVGEGDVYRARKVKLDHYIEQGGEVIVPAIGQQFQMAVIRGQRRLAHGQLVEILPSEDRQPDPLEPDLRLPTATAVNVNVP